MRLSEQLRPEMVLIGTDVADRDELFDQLGHRLAELGEVRDGDDVIRRLREREAILSTGIGGGVAVPHAQLPRLGRIVLAASTHPRGLDYPALDGAPVHLVFCLLGDCDTTADHLAGLARLARLARRPDAVGELVASRTPDEFVAALDRLESA